ncbi:MAG: DUF5597 domain-containing protein [Saprospiraceae bacterium]|nr:DUF5597 domain-containing protein [Saprospiraceae bacterium]
MKRFIQQLSLSCWLIGVFTIVSLAQNSPTPSKSIPHLKQQGGTTQLIVHDKPYLILGGELANSSFTSTEYMQPIWPKLKALHLNTVLAPVYWELIEPEEGVFDFALLDQLIFEAKRHDFKLILLWFASWKNSMSSHVPSWVKTDQERFPRVKDDQGKSHEILTPFSESNLMADLRAYQALMRHIKEIDGEQHTIIMMQPENEIGMLPVARDHSLLANKQFSADVPVALMKYLVENKSSLVPEFYERWKQYGFKTEGNWEDIFGVGSHTDELFMAWYYAKFTNKIVEAGKAIHPLPMFVNAALIRPGRKPGTGYPSAGPLPHIMDIWKAGAPSIDFFSPDFYFPNIEYWCDLYTRQGNPLFIPEHRFDNTVAAKAFFTIGHYESLGFSPFSIDSKPKPAEEDLAKGYKILAQLTPLITEQHGQGKIKGILLDKEKQETILTFGPYEFVVKHSHTLGWSAEAKNEVWEPAGAIIIQTQENEFYVAGTGVAITFRRTDADKIVGILKADEGYFDQGNWNILRHLNGDQTHQGRHIRIFQGNYTIQRFELYDYE